MIDKVYISLAERLREQIPTLEWIDLFNNQYNNEDREHPFPDKTILIEFLGIDWTTSTSNIQEGNCTIRLHVVQQSMLDTFNADQMNDPAKSAAFEHLQFLNLVHAAIQGFTPIVNENIIATAMDRRTTQPDNNHDSLVIFILEYLCNIYDDSADHTKDQEEVTLSLITLKESPIVRPE